MLLSFILVYAETTQRDCLEYRNFHLGKVDLTTMHKVGDLVFYIRPNEL